MTGPFSRDPTTHAGATIGTQGLGMHRRTLASASRILFLLVACLRLPHAVLTLHREIPDQVTVTWLLRLGRAGEVVGWLTVLAAASLGQFRARGRRGTGVWLPSAVVAGCTIVMVGEALRTAGLFGLLDADWSTAMSPARLLVRLGVHASGASTTVACVVVAVVWRRKVAHRGRDAGRWG